jgi:hypothetical protein
VDFFNDEGIFKGSAGAFRSRIEIRWNQASEPFIGLVIYPPVQQLKEFL